MGPCDDIQNLLLDYVYGLLDGADEQSVRAHLADCPACQAAHAEAQSQQFMLARAAQVYGEIPVFTPPADDEIGTIPLVSARDEAEAPPIAPEISRRSGGRRWPWIAAAASVLLVGGAITLGAVYQEGLSRHQTELADARSQVEASDAQFAQVQKTFAENKKKLPRQVQEQFAHLQVVGPASYRPDAPCPVRVITRDLAGKPLRARVVATLKSADKELFKKELATPGEVVVSLPPGLSAAAGQAQLIVQARSDGASVIVKENIGLEKPAHVTHLTLSKPAYQVGEVLFFRTLTLQRFSLKPPEEKLALTYSLVDAQGKVVKQLHGQVGPGGIGGGELALTNDLLSGEYRLEVAGETTQSRKLAILRDASPQLQFDRLQYHPGETVKAKFKSRQQEGAANRPLEVKAQVDGKAISVNGAAPGAAAQVRTDKMGNAAFQFRLPAPITRGSALMEVELKDAKRAEKLVQPIPVVASQLAVEFFPEGGDLLAGVPGRVYYRIRTPLGEPVNPQGQFIILSRNKVVLDTEQKQGLGVFTFTPDPKEKYRLWITYPGGVTEIADPFKNSPIRAEGVALNVPEAVSPENKPLQVELWNTGSNRRLAILATCRGRLVGEQFIVAPKGNTKVDLAPVAGTRGMVRLTVYEAGGDRLVPLAERLVYRVPADPLQLSVPNLKKSYPPGTKVQLPIEVANGGKAPTWLLAAVVDETYLRPDSFQSQDSHFLLLSDIRHPQDLENADLLLADSRAGRHALDLFLGTQGWRRFTHADQTESAPVFAQAKKSGSSTARLPALLSRENDSPANLTARAEAKLGQALEQLRREAAAKRLALTEEKDRRSAEARFAAVALAEFKNKPAEYLRLGLGILVLVLLLAGGAFLLVGLVRMLRRAGSPTGAMATAFGALLGCLVLFGARGSLPEGNPREAKELLAWLTTTPWPGLGETVPAVERQTVATNDFPVGTFVAAVPEGKTPALANTAPQSKRSYLAKADMAAGEASHKLNRNLQMEQRFAQALQKVPATSATSKGAQPPHAMPGVAAEKEASTREFANFNSPKDQAADTLLWHPNLFAAAGSAHVTFELPRVASTYRIVIFGNDSNGRLGVFQGKLDVRRHGK